MSKTTRACISSSFSGLSFVFPMPTGVALIITSKLSFRRSARFTVCAFACLASFCPSRCSIHHPNVRAPFFQSKDGRPRRSARSQHQHLRLLNRQPLFQRRTTPAISVLNPYNLPSCPRTTVLHARSSRYGIRVIQIGQIACLYGIVMLKPCSGISLTQCTRSFNVSRVAEHKRHLRSLAAMPYS